MQHLELTPARRLAVGAGLAYLGIIALGLWAEVAVRAQLIDPADPLGTAANIAAHPMLFRLSIAADAVMVVLDIALAVLLFALFRPVAPLLASAAIAFRLIQASVIAGTLTVQHGALNWATMGAGFTADDRALLAMQGLQAHALGYDIGLIFFGFASLSLAAILARVAPRILAAGVFAAGLVYLTGSTLRLLAPTLADGFAIAYLIPVIAELTFALWLLLAAGRKGSEGRMVGDRRFELLTSTM